MATDTGELPESWCRDPEHYPYYNSPLCWSHALHVIAASLLGQQAGDTATPPQTGSRPEVVALPGVRDAAAGQ